MNSSVFPSFLFHAALIRLIAGPEEVKNLAGESPPPDSDPFSNAEFGENLVSLSSQFVNARRWNALQFDGLKKSSPAA
jgi:hypothetical protein